MDVERSHEEVAEDALDEEIRAALAVEPSPLFLAGVRGRIASEPKALPWNWRWVSATSGAMVLAGLGAVFVIMTFQWQPTVPFAIESPPPAANQSEGPRMSPLRAAAGAPDELVDPPRSGRLPAKHQEPPVIISPGEARALRMLLEAVGTDAIQFTPVITDRLAADATLQPIEDIPVPPIAVPPIAIEPLPPFAQ